MTHEQLILEWERPLVQIAAAADMKAEFDKGYQKPTDKVVLYIDDQQVQAQRLGQDVNDLQGEITHLHGQVAQMRRQLGGVAEERVVLSEQLESQMRARQQVEKVERLFTRNEARVLRESSDVIIRLVGLSFDVGQANIDPKNFQLLTKVQNAIRTFPRITSYNVCYTKLLRGSPPRCSTGRSISSSIWGSTCAWEPLL